MRPKGFAYFLRFGLIIAGLLAIVGGGIYVGLNYVNPAPPPEIALPVLATPIPTASATPTLSITPTETPTPSNLSNSPTATPKPKLPLGGIVYTLSPDINSIGWVQAGEEGNHFGESFLYAGLREGLIHHGAIQFDLSFIPKGATIFLAELELTGLVDRGLTRDSSFALNILAEEIDAGWSRHDFEAIHTAAVDETLPPILQADDLAQERSNKFIFNAAQRSIIEERLESHLLSFRLDGLSPEGWFGWDSGYGSQTQGQGVILRLGMVPPPATEVAVGTVDAAGTPTPTPTFVVVTTMPTPENILTAAAIAPALTYEATTTGTPTPLPENWVTPWVVTNTPTSQNEATALYQQAEATAMVIAYGTSTPTPNNLVTATPNPTETPTPVFILLNGELPPMPPEPTLAITPGPTPPIPSELIGKIAFKSNRTGREEFYVINPDGSGLALLTNRWPYNMAKLADTFSAEGRYRVFTKDTVQYIRSDSGVNTTVTKSDVPAIFWYDTHYKVEEQLTFFGAGISYGGVWSPTNEQIAFISNDSADDEIWVINRDGSDPLQLTGSNEAYNALEIGKDSFIPEINKHPSWSPDGKQIVFWSNRTGHRQIWAMDADGSNLYSLSRTGFDDWDPVWIKYPGIPANAQEIHIPYIGPYDPFGVDRNCEHFDSDTEPHESVEAFYIAAGGPARDPHDLDPNNNGLACE